MLTALWPGCASVAQTATLGRPAVAQMRWAQSAEWTGCRVRNTGSQDKQLKEGSAMTPCNLGGRVGPHFRQGQPREGGLPR